MQTPRTWPASSALSGASKPHPASGQIGFYGDDFTGATDTLAVAAQSGLRTVLFMAVPDAATVAAAGPLDCIGVAGAARAMQHDELVAELAAAADFFAGLGVRVLHYKTCSTFDSSPALGNIALAVATLRKRFANPFVPIVGGQPNLGRYCVFGNLFASLTTGGPVYRIDRHPTMRHHPVTPMLEADLGRHLAQQGFARVLGIDYTRYTLPPAQLALLLEQTLQQAPDAVLFDVANAGQLSAIGALLWRHAARAALVAVGPSSVVQALTAAPACRAAPPMLSAPPRSRPSHATGPVFVLAGSLSPVTAAQIEGASAFERLPLDAARLLAGDSHYTTVALANAAAHLRAGRHVLAHTGAPPDRASSTASGTASGIATDSPARQLALAHGAFLRRLLECVPLRRIGVAGGDTSSFALKALDVWGLSYLGSLAPGVALCRAHAHSTRLDGMELMLKGGQMGPPDMFARLLEPAL